jgi:hypothetical protein
MLISVVWMTAALACAYSTSGRWEQTGRTAADADNDQTPCHKVALEESESDGQPAGMLSKR